MKVFYILFNFFKGFIFFGVDKSSFYIILFKGIVVKIFKEKYVF